MNLFNISFAYFRANKLSSYLNVIIFALGFSLIMVSSSIESQINNKLKNDLNQIDLVLGAKGSKLQLALATVWHLDIPNQNIKYQDYQKIKKNRNIKKSLPIALGDNYKNYRIIGTHSNYLSFFNMKLAAGENWHEPMQAVIGSEIAAKLKLQIGDNFVSNHGITHSAHNHDQDIFTISGILAKQGNIRDNLIFTDLKSIWQLHDGHQHHEPEHEHHVDNDHKNQAGSASHKHHDHDHDHNHQEDKHKKHNHNKAKPGKNDTYLMNKEVTAIYVQLKSPVALINLPRQINDQTNLVASNPAFEITKLSKMFGFAYQAFLSFSLVILVIAIVNIALNLLNSLKQRKYDLLIFRMIGCSHYKICSLIILEALIIVIIGSLLSYPLANLLIKLIDIYLIENAAQSLSLLVINQKIIFSWFATICVIVLTSVIPALIAYKKNIREILNNA